MFKEHNLGNIGTRPLNFEEERRLVQRVDQRYEELNKDYIQLKVRNTRLLSDYFLDSSTSCIVVNMRSLRGDSAYSFQELKVEMQRSQDK